MMYLGMLLGAVILVALLLAAAVHIGFRAPRILERGTPATTSCCWMHAITGAVTPTAIHPYPASPRMSARRPTG